MAMNLDALLRIKANVLGEEAIRRLGIQFKRETGGKELTRKNLELIVARMRIGGRLLLGGACAKMTTLPLA